MYGPKLARLKCILNYCAFTISFSLGLEIAMSVIMLQQLQGLRKTELCTCDIEYKSYPYMVVINLY